MLIIDPLPQYKFIKKNFIVQVINLKFCFCYNLFFITFSGLRISTKFLHFDL